jgi:hypothetical protein
LAASHRLLPKRKSPSPAKTETSSAAPASPPLSLTPPHARAFFSRSSPNARKTG